MSQSCHRPRVLFTCGREPTYVRNAVLRRALQDRFDVVEVTSHAHSYLRRFVEIAGKLAFRRPDYDVAVAGFLGQPLGLALTSLRSTPVVTDCFVSLFDTICLDRRLASPSSPVGSAVRALEALVARRSALSLTDTREHSRLLQQLYGVAADRTVSIPVGFDDRIFERQPQSNASTPLRVVYYCSFMPLHGAEIVVEAAARLRDHDEIIFDVIGEGPNRRSCEEIAREERLTNLQFHPWMAPPALARRIGLADICLAGPFGSTGKAGRVVTGKTFQVMAVGRPTIVGDSPATRDIFIDETHALFCRRGDPASLAQAILRLAGDSGLRTRLAGNTADYVWREFGPDAMAQRVERAVMLALDSRPVVSL